MFYGSTVVGPALVTDIVPKAALGRGLSLYNATTWVGGIIGMGLTGHAIQGFGMVTTFIATAFLPVVALLLLIPVRPAETPVVTPAGN
jgi:MFS family permease